MARAVDIPVIASGGVGTLEHLARGLTVGEADAVLAASIFHFGTYTIAETKAYLAARGIPVRAVAWPPDPGPAPPVPPPGEGRGAVTRPVTIALAALGAADAERLEERITAAHLACFPTDTVYGIGGALAPAVAAALVAAKGRAPGKPLQVVFPTVAALESAVGMAPELQRACRRLLPGPVTLLVPYPAGWHFPPPGEAGDAFGRPAVPTLGVRVPAWPPAARALAGLRRPLVASSANPAGGSPPAALSGVDAALLARCDLVLDAGPVSGLASSVVDLSRYSDTGRWRLVRAGPWGEDEVAARLAGTQEEPPTS